MLINGSCHCGNITFALDWQPDPETIPARACTCTFCTRHGGLWTSYPEGKLRVRVADPARISRYAFGTGTAAFQVCMTCGVVPLVTSRIDGRLYAVVNVNTFENVDPARLQRSSSNLDGEGVGDRLARRQRNWIRQVDFPAADG